MYIYQAFNSIHFDDSTQLKRATPRTGASQALNSHSAGPAPGLQQRRSASAISSSIELN